MNKWEITDNEMERFVKSLFKDEEKFHNALDNACDLQYDSNVKEVFLENTNFKDSYYGNYFKVGIPKKKIQRIDYHPDAVYARMYTKHRDAFERMTPEQRKQYYS